jgi:DNA-binding SARP family transcriptional activator
VNDGKPVFVAGTRLRALLILLALNPGRLVGTTQLIDGIWGDDPPAGADNALQALGSRLRRALPEVTLESERAGYRLAIDPDNVDVTRS